MEPNILSYKQITHYFQDYFKFRRSLDKSYSYDVWAAELGFKSRSFIRMIANGEKTITPKFSKTFCSKMNFTHDQENYFLLLTSYHQARTASQKALFLEKIYESQQTIHPPLEIKDYALFLSDPFISVVFLLLGYQDVVGNLDKLKKLTGLTSAKIKKIVGILEDLGMIKVKSDRDGVKTWKALVNNFKVPNKNKDQHLAQYHQRNLDEATSVLKMDTSYKKFRTILFSTEEDQLLGLSKEVEIFLTRLKQKYESTELNNKRIVKLNLNLYPVTLPRKSQ